MPKPIPYFKILLILTILSGTVILFPFLDFHGTMAVGDHGLNYYAFDRVRQGDMPYRDFWWLYGPLMPYYYSLAERLFGATIAGMLIGKIILFLISGMFIFLTLTRLTFPLAGFAAAFWFFVFGDSFVYAPNHVGGTAVVCVTMFCMASYLMTQKDKWLWGGLGTALLLGLIKLNFGIAALAALLVTSVSTDGIFKVQGSSRKGYFYLAAVFLFPVVLAGIYFSMMNGLKGYEVGQCLPYFHNEKLYRATVGGALLSYFQEIWARVAHFRSDLIFLILVMTSLGRVVYLLLGNTVERREKIWMFLFIGIFGIYYLLNLHEFLIGGLWFRRSWAQPIGIVWMFGVMAMSIKMYSRFTQVVVFGFVVILAIAWQKDVYARRATLCTPQHYLAHPRARVFVANDPDWVKTVLETTAFLEHNLDPKETFLAVPYDGLYYFLTNRKSPTWLFMFFNCNKIPPQQEEEYIRDLEAHNIRYVLLSSHSQTTQDDLGVFGVTNSPRLGKYIQENFVPVAEFGDWNKPAEWAINHSTRILKRREKTLGR